MPTNIKKTCLNINCPERNGGECTAEPTNNQEKWIEEFMHRFAGDNRSDGMGWKLHLEVIDFLRQEIRQAKIEGNLRREKEILIMLVDCEKEGWTIKRFIDSFTQIIDKNERESSNLKTK